MHTERKYKVVMLLASLLTIVLVGNAVREPSRIQAAGSNERQEYVRRGAAIYATQCVQCHGPKGEGVIGMPLNRAALRADASSPEGQDLYDFIYEAIWRGRPGFAEHPRWVKTPDGRWLSYTNMAAFGYPLGGALNEDQTRALTLFIMEPEGTQWSFPGSPVIAPFDRPSYQVDEDGLLRLPDPPGLDPAVSATAKSLLRDRTKSQCLNCHLVGGTGVKNGPDLSDLGRWGLDREFLIDFLRYANQPMHAEDPEPPIAHDLRMPVYWSAHRAVNGPEPELQNPVVSAGPYYMLRFSHRLTDAEIEALADYLLALRLK